MRVLIINSCSGRLSTGRIAARAAQDYIDRGDAAVVAFGRSMRDVGVPVRRIGTKADVCMHALESRLLDNAGFGSRRATAAFLKWATAYDPETLWLHNLHGYYINVEMLFSWIKSRPQMKVLWTLHDCWPFTGHCTHFTYVGCEKWKTGCGQCPQKTCYPACFGLDRSHINYEKKRELFTGVKDMTLITPSNWLADLVRQSFLGDYPVEVRYNSIDTTVFKPTPSDFRKQHGLVGQKIVLGVANPWSPRKGLSDFHALPAFLGKDYTIVLVGLNERQLADLPAGILGLPRTDSPEELAAVYTTADVFVNPTYEDNYPTVNLEARACGTPVITYDTGGSPESAGPDAVVVPCGDIQALAARIHAMLE